MQNFNRTLFAHIDTSHYYSDTHAELLGSTRLATNKSIIVLDDWNEIYPQVRAAYFHARYVEKIEYEVALVAHNKAYLVHNENFNAFTDEILGLKTHLDSLGFQSQLIRTDESSNYRAFHVRPLKNDDEVFYGATTYNHRSYKDLSGYVPE